MSVVVLVDPVVLVTEVDVLACGVGPDEHPAMTMAMTTANRTAADLLTMVLAGVTVDVTPPLLPPAGSGGGCPNARLVGQRTVDPEGDDARRVSP